MNILRIAQAYEKIYNIYGYEYNNLFNLACEFVKKNNIHINESKQNI